MESNQFDSSINFYFNRSCVKNESLQELLHMRRDVISRRMKKNRILFSTDTRERDRKREGNLDSLLNFEL